MGDDDRLDRAAAAFVRQEFSAPVAAIVGFTEILREDARRRRLDNLVDDIEQIGDAGEQLRGLLTDLLETRSAPTGVAAEDKMRHDLRTPLSAIRRHGEKLRAQVVGAGHQDFADDIGRLLSAADDLLGRIDALIDFGATAKDGTVAGDPANAPRDLVARAIEFDPRRHRDRRAAPPNDQPHPGRGRRRFHRRTAEPPARPRRTSGLDGV